jgi:hypothetical protein
LLFCDVIGRKDIEDDPRFDTAPRRFGDAALKQSAE